jgi:DNA invertase Pin-like site-specific DNA recombinase
MEAQEFSDKTKAGIAKAKALGYLTHRPLEYGEAFRLAAVELHELGLGVRAIAATLGCSVGTAVNLCKCEPIAEIELKRKERTLKTTTRRAA